MLERRRRPEILSLWCVAAGGAKKARAEAGLGSGRELLRGPRYVHLHAVPPCCFLVVGGVARLTAVRTGDPLGREGGNKIVPVVPETPPAGQGGLA